MELNTIYEPIKQELYKLQQEINLFINHTKRPEIRRIYERFFVNRGKNLRPSLLFLSTKAVNSDTACLEDDLIKLALSLELLHNASLVHDDIIDKDITRRGQETINYTYGNKIAVLVGDTFFSYSFALVSNLFPKEYSQAITNLALEMCVAEIEQAKKVRTLVEYFDIIQGKTAKFMSVCCELGARYAKAEEREIKLFADFGLYLGMVYQIKDDLKDEDPNALKFITLEHAEIFSDKAKVIMGEVSDSIYKQSLLDLLAYIMNN